MPARALGLIPTVQDLIRLEGEAKGFSFLSNQPVKGVLAGKRASRIRGRGLSFEELRAYQPGDDVRMMDWRATARTGKPQVRVYTEERERPVLLVVDLTSSMFFGTQRSFKATTAAEVCALVAWRSLAAGDRVGAILFDGSGTEVFRPAHSRSAVARLLGAVARRVGALPDEPMLPAGPDPFNAALLRAETLANHGALVILIYDVFAANAAAAATATRIGRHNDIVAIPISDPLERNLPPPPWRGVATDGPRTSTLDGSRDGAWAADGFSRRLAAMRQAGRRHGTPVLPIGAEDAASVQLRRLLGQTQVRSSQSVPR